MGPFETHSAGLPIRIADLLRRVNGLYAALIRCDGETIVSAGDQHFAHQVTPLSLALLEGGGDLCGDSPFEQAHLSSATRVLNVHRVDKEHVLCVVLEPRTASAQLFIRAEAAALRRAALPGHERLSRVPDATS